MTIEWENTANQGTARTKLIILQVWAWPKPGWQVMGAGTRLASGAADSLEAAQVAAEQAARAVLQAELERLG